MRAATTSAVTSAISIQLSDFSFRLRLYCSYRFPVSSFQLLILTPRTSNEDAWARAPNPESRLCSPGLHLAPATAMLKRLIAVFGGKNRERRDDTRAPADDLPAAAHPAVRSDEPKPLDDMPVPPLTDPNETKGG